MMAMELNSADAKEWVLRNDVEHWSHARFPGQRFGSLNTQAICSITFCHLHGIKFEVIESMKTYAVDLHLQTCSCGHWQHVKIPCKHACTVIDSN
ncbi:hypothetical protein Taro_037178 [Colocasia esculenta]|uniref:SWIM-type domain-containing protein n=1 Tax=Colocasia esculenta TaxID=4460 RepID=A0A843WNX1_COLES|nr:hypothetical protein [Colocasia esculenta]